MLIGEIGWKKKKIFFGEIGWINIICTCKENLYEKKERIYMQREKKWKKKKIGFMLKTLWLTWKPWNFGNAYFHNFFLFLRFMWVYKTLGHMKTPCMLEFLFHWELYCIVLGDHVWKCLYASGHELHSVKHCIKWKREYWYSMYNLFFFFLKTFSPIVVLFFSMGENCFYNPFSS